MLFYLFTFFFSFYVGYWFRGSWEDHDNTVKEVCFSTFRSFFEQSLLKRDKKKILSPHYLKT